MTAANSMKTNPVVVGITGASGAAIQNLNLMLGISENTGLPEAAD